MRYLELVLEETRRENVGGVWCLPRCVAEKKEERRKRRGETLEKEDELSRKLDGVGLEDRVKGEKYVFQRNLDPDSRQIVACSTLSISIPPLSTVVQGKIADTLHVVHVYAPLGAFGLILMDPPWPNRSAKRKGSYSISTDTHQLQDLLLSLPIPELLSQDGLVGVWVTNKKAFRGLLLDPCGVFDLWGLRLVEEWLWVKTTKEGEPICELGSVWRRPWEVLLVGRRKGEEKGGDGDRAGDGSVKRRVIFGVPDLHSRKPSLKEVFERLRRYGDEDFGGVEEGEPLEIFARSATKGWWSWGDEVLKFQDKEAWI